MQYSCNSGFCSKGDMSLRCGDIGRWSGVVPRCKRKSFNINLCEVAFETKDVLGLQCKPLKELDNGTVSDTDAYVGMSVSYSCKPGYDLTGQRTSTCLAVVRSLCKTKWSSDSPVCSGKSSVFFLAIICKILAFFCYSSEELWLAETHETWKHYCYQRGW